jgi:hypothetical protein
MGAGSDFAVNIQTKNGLAARSASARKRLVGESWGIVFMQKAWGAVKIYHETGLA